MSHGEEAWIMDLLQAKRLKEKGSRDVAFGGGFVNVASAYYLAAQVVAFGKTALSEHTIIQDDGTRRYDDEALERKVAYIQVLPKPVSEFIGAQTQMFQTRVADALAPKAVKNG